MVDTFDFEALLEARLRARAALASRPFDATGIAHEAIAAGTRRRVLGRLEWPSVRPAFAWVVVGLLLVLALLGAVTLVGALLPKAPPRLPLGASGGWLAFALPDGSGGASEIYTVKDGTAERRIIGSDGNGLRDVCPSFSPDGTKLAYSEREAIPVVGDSTTTGAVVIVAMDAGMPVGSEVRLPALAGGDACPKWASDGQTVFLAGGDGAWLGRLDGTTVGGPFGVDPSAGQSDWSPDGTAIVGLRVRGGSLVIVPFDGSAPRVLANADATSAFEQPRWSPDGTRIAVMVGSSIEVYRADGSGSPIELGSGIDPAWSPDGHQIAYVRSTTSLTGPNRTDLVTVSPDTGEVHVITSDPGGIDGFAWAPDGTGLVYAEPNSGPTGALVSVSAVGDADPIVLTQQPHDLEFTDSNDLSWQPVVTPRQSPAPVASDSSSPGAVVFGSTPGTFVVTLGSKFEDEGSVTCQSTGDGQLSIGYDVDSDSLSLVFRSGGTVSSLSGAHRGVIWKVTQSPEGTLNADKSGTFSGKDAISGAEVSGAFACP